MTTTSSAIFRCFCSTWLAHHRPSFFAMLQSMLLHSQHLMNGPYRLKIIRSRAQGKRKGKFSRRFVSVCPTPSSVFGWVLSWHSRVAMRIWIRIRILFIADVCCFCTPNHADRDAVDACRVLAAGRWQCNPTQINKNHRLLRSMLPWPRLSSTKQAASVDGDLAAVVILLWLRFTAHS